MTAHPVDLGESPALEQQEDKSNSILALQQKELAAKYQENILLAEYNALKSRPSTALADIDAAFDRLVAASTRVNNLEIDLHKLCKGPGSDENGSFR